MEGDVCELARRIRAGELSCFDDIVAWYSRDVLNLCHALLWNEEEAKDILQEAMLRLVRAVKDRRLRNEQGSVKGFVLKTTRNLCIDRIREKKIREDQRNTQGGSVDNVDASANWTDARLFETRTPDRAAEESLFESAFYQAVSTLSDRERVILVLHDVNGESSRDIADSLALTVNCVKVHLHNARKKMRARLAAFVEEK